LENYKYIFTVDATFNKMLVSTLKTTLLNVPVVVIFSFFLASVLNGNFFGRSLARTILFLPLILFSNIVMSLMRSDAVSASIAEKSGVVTGEFSGVFAELLNKAHISTSVSSILTSSVDNIGNILAMSVIPTIVILAGLQSISASVYEASYMEGATPWEVFWKISLPIVSPMILVSVIYCIIDSFTSVSNTVISRVRKECFTNLSLGLGSAMAWSYLLIVLLIVGACYLVANKFVSYSD
ncbi:MAG: sugar ABC transporter permease, partial [Eubacteriales bacterium]|nr:sugar ABC transporter permease [Eubacteriales bacterium]